MAASNVKQAIKSAIDMTLLPLIHLNADVWTSQVTCEKFLGVRVFWKVGKVLKQTVTQTCRSQVRVSGQGGL
jgi:hypothetical protein